MQYGKMIDSAIVLSMMAVCLAALRAVIAWAIADPTYALYVGVIAGWAIIVVSLERLADIWQGDGR